MADIVSFKILYVANVTFLAPVPVSRMLPTDRAVVTRSAATSLAETANRVLRSSQNEQIILACLRAAMSRILMA